MLVQRNSKHTLSAQYVFTKVINKTQRNVALFEPFFVTI